MLLSNLDLLATAPGGVARLRELILTLAVQGKLVPQDPADAPAGVLLQKIRAEKDRLIAEGKSKRDKPLAAMAEEEKPFALQQGWEWVRLGQMTEIKGGKRLPAGHTFTDGKTPHAYIQVTNMKAGTIATEHLKYLKPETHAAIRNYTISDADLYITIAGTIGQVGEVPSECHLMNLTENAAKIVFRFLNKRWLREVLNSSICQSQFAEKTVQQAQPKLALHRIADSLIPLPPLAEQSRIVTRVEELMRLCDALEAKGQLEAAQHAQLVSTLLGALTASTTPEELADHWQCVAQHFDLLAGRPAAIDALEQTLLQLAVRGLLVPQDPTDEPASVLLARIRTEKDRLIAEGKIKRDKPLPPITDEEKPFELPMGWEWVRFDELTHPQKPIAYGVLVPGPDVATGVPFVRIADLSLVNPPEKPEKTISPEVDAQFQRTRLEGGEILMGVVGSIGKLGVAPKSWAGANIARAICRIVPADAGLHDFVLFLLETKFMQESFAGDTRTLAQPTLNVGLIRAAMTPMPPPAEQARIVTRVTVLRRLCANLRQRLAEREAVQARLAEALVANNAQTSTQQEDECHAA